nr:MAG TPA: hypothetical protein [Caudoviricetes sp.]
MVLTNRQDRVALNPCRFEFLFLFSRGFGHGIFLIVLKKIRKIVLLFVQYDFSYYICSVQIKEIWKK